MDPVFLTPKPVLFYLSVGPKTSLRVHKYSFFLLFLVHLFGPKEFRNPFGFFGGSIERPLRTHRCSPGVLVRLLVNRHPAAWKLAAALHAEEATAAGEALLADAARVCAPEDLPRLLSYCQAMGLVLGVGGWVGGGGGRAGGGVSVWVGETG